MQIQQLRYFIVLVEKNNFTEAARECFVSQPNMSQQIKALEKELEVKLLKRNGRSFEITPAGRLFYQRALHIIHELDSLCVQIQRVARNMGSTLRLGLLSSMDREKLPEKLKEQILNRTGMDTELFYGSHDELYELFGNGCLNAFISDERRLTVCESFSKLRLFATKIYLEAARTLDLPHSGIYKLKMETECLSSLKLYIVCSPEHLEEESLLYDQLLEGSFKYQAVSSLAEGRKLLQSGQEQAALLLDRSLMRGDQSFHNKMFRYELTHQGTAVKRQLCCYSRNNFGLAELDELCNIFIELGCKPNRLDEIKRDLISFNYQESPENTLTSLPPPVISSASDLVF